MVKYLVDTCVWRDVMEARHSRYGKPLGEFAQRFFIKAIDNQDTIIFSDGVEWELRNAGYSIKFVLSLLDKLCLLKRIYTTKHEKEEAKSLSKQRKLPFIDCLCAIQARNQKAIIVTQDRHYSKFLSDICSVINP